MAKRSKHMHSTQISARMKGRAGILIMFIFVYGSCMFTSIAPKYAFAAVISPAAIRVYGQNGSFSSNNGVGVSANSLNGPRRIAIDSGGNYYVSDTGNNRVLFFPAGSTTATRVYGQGGSFTINAINNGGLSATSLNQPRGVVLDSSDNLYLTDSSNNRVLFFPAGSTTATRVYGQGGSFTTNTINKDGLSATSLNQPYDLTLDSSGNLYVSDSSNNRMLFFPAGSTTATRVYGQGGSFTTNTINKGGLSATSLFLPCDLKLDSSGNLYVVDTSNNRALFFPAGGTTATRVYGQGGSFASNLVNKGGLSATSLNQPLDVTLDSGSNFYISDSGNSRVLFFPADSTTATRVYGQGGSFTSNAANLGGISASSLNGPRGITTDNHGNVIIADTFNNRLLVFQTALRVMTQPPASVAVGTAFSVVVSLVDVGSNSVYTNFTNSVSLAITSGSGAVGAVLSGTTSVAAVNGVATFSDLALNLSGTSYTLTVSSPGVASVDTTTFTVSGGLLFIPLTSPLFTFTLDGTTGITTTQRTFRVSNSLAPNTGWHMTITSSQFTASGNKTLSTTSTTITNVSAACTEGQTCTLPTNTVNYPLTIPAGTSSPAAATYFRAISGTGTGDITLTATYALSVAPGTASGSYTGIFTDTLVKGQ